jgi:hypothetical protein
MRQLAITIHITGIWYMIQFMPVPICGTSLPQKTTTAVKSHLVASRVQHLAHGVYGI